MTRGTFESLCAHSVCVWPGKRRDEERGLYASALHRLSPALVCGEWCSLCAWKQAREGELPPQTLNHPAQKWENKMLKLEEIKKQRNLSPRKQRFLGQWIMFAMSIPSKRVLNGWISQGYPVDFNPREGGCETSITACSDCWLWSFVLLQSDGCVEYPLRNH